MAERRAPARRRVIRMRSSMEPIRARRSNDGRRCVLWFERPENCSKILGKRFVAGVLHKFESKRIPQISEIVAKGGTDS